MIILFCVLGVLFLPAYCYVIARFITKGIYVSYIEELNKIEIKGEINE